ncbi:hypothetical protein MMC18_004014 [Xylographa bjoerkii]|nr:hypothetical protein [Xylographa bjoerkii]
MALNSNFCVCDAGSESHPRYEARQIDSRLSFMIRSTYLSTSQTFAVVSFLFLNHQKNIYQEPDIYIIRVLLKPPTPSVKHPRHTPSTLSSTTILNLQPRPHHPRTLHSLPQPSATDLPTTPTMCYNYTIISNCTHINFFPDTVRCAGYRTRRFCHSVEEKIVHTRQTCQECQEKVRQRQKREREETPQKTAWEMKRLGESGTSL